MNFNRSIPKDFFFCEAAVVPNYLHNDR